MKRLPEGGWRGRAAARRAFRTEMGWRGGDGGAEECEQDRTVTAPMREQFYLGRPPNIKPCYNSPTLVNARENNTNLFVGITVLNFEWTSWSGPYAGLPAKTLDYCSGFFFVTKNKAS